MFESPVLGGQLALGLIAIASYNGTRLKGTSPTSAGEVVLTRTGTLDRACSGFGDLFAQTSLRWNSGIDNYMAYIRGG